MEDLLIIRKAEQGVEVKASISSEEDVMIVFDAIKQVKGILVKFMLKKSGKDSPEVEEFREVFQNLKNKSPEELEQFMRDLKGLIRGK